MNKSELIEELSIAHGSPPQEGRGPGELHLTP
jgi:hypothetical protein